jgi:hypothetical protein
MNTELELKPCPHCGGKAIYTNVDGYEAKGDYKTYWCRCGECDKVGIPYAVDFWNTRPIEDQLRAELEAAKAAIRAVFENPYGCPFCDCGKLRKPDDPRKGHDDDCPYALLRQVIEKGGER